MGRRGCGKSYLAQNIQKRWPRRIIIDSLDEYSDGDHVTSFDGFCEKLEYYKTNEIKEFVLVFKFNPETEENEDTFNEILRIAFYFKDVQIVIEEVQLYSTPHSLPHWLKQNLLIGRHHDISILFTTQRPGQLNKTCLSQCSHIFCGQIVEGNDLRYISSFLNQDANQLSSLPDRKFLYFNGDSITMVSNDL